MNITIQEIKYQMQGREDEFIRQYLNEYQLNGKNQPCPHCEGTDRYRALKDGSGGFFCSHSQNGFGDVIDHVAHTQAMTKAQAIEAAKVFLGLQNPTAKQRKEAEERRLKHEAKVKEINRLNVDRLQLKSIMNDMFFIMKDSDLITENERNCARGLMRMLKETYSRKELTQ